MGEIADLSKPLEPGFYWVRYRRDRTTGWTEWRWIVAEYCQGLAFQHPHGVPGVGSDWISPQYEVHLPRLQEPRGG